MIALLCSILLKIKALMELLKESQEVINSDTYDQCKQELIMLIKEAKGFLASKPYMTTIVASLDSILTKIQNSNDSLSEIISDLQNIRSELITIYTDAKDAISNVLDLIHNIESLGKVIYQDIVNFI